MAKLDPVLRHAITPPVFDGKTRYHRDRLVDAIHANIPRKLIAVAAPPGFGKTTLLRLITGILKPDAGSVRFMGKEIVGRKTWDIVNMGIACTFQNMRPFRRLPIIANVMVSCLSPRAMKRGEWVKRLEAKAMDALEFAGISDMARERHLPFRRVTLNGWKWRGRWPRIRNCSCWMSLSAD
jgi:ABC-type branched-subunit amino acid transport system ATPase component